MLSFKTPPWQSLPLVLLLQEKAPSPLIDGDNKPSRFDSMNQRARINILPLDHNQQIVPMGTLRRIRS